MFYSFILKTIIYMYMKHDFIIINGCQVPGKCFRCQKTDASSLKTMYRS